MLGGAMRIARAFVALTLGLVACPKPSTPPSDGTTPPGTELQGGGQGPDVPPDDVKNDPCAGKELPPCPAQCTQPPGQQAGTDCTPDGSKCGNDIGDGCECTGGKWSCTVHAPLGGPGTCNLVCR
jgi:hypothetical protein